MRLPRVLLLSLLLAFAQHSLASDTSKKEHELKQLNAEIDKLRQTIEVKENSRSIYNRQLRHIEKEIGELSAQIRKSSQAVKVKQMALSQLQKNKRIIQQNISDYNRQLSQQMHAAYTLGKQERIKLLFSQQNASSLQRNLTYYEYFSNYRVKQIDASTRIYDQLLDNEKETIRTKNELESVLAQQQSQKEKLGSDQAQRKKIVASLEIELTKQGKYLTRLEEDAQHLKQLIDSLSAILVENPEDEKSTQRFDDLRNRLAWPVKGQVKNLYGKNKPPSSLRWQGVIIQANQGNNVRAVSHGRIAFADWLRGMGNLIIIDHGDGFLSLYGHNESLYKAAGEWVEAGEIIGSIGNSGGQSEAGLYFEIRKKGKPQNPSNWCNTSNWFATL